MPPDVFDQPSRYFSNSHARRDLPIPADPDDGDEARALVVRGRVEEILDEPELAVASDERRLETDRTSLASSRADDPRGSPELDRLCLPLQLVRARVLVGDRRL